ncbi:MAG TPA: hypothetical protein VGM23_08985, partial [Armatimonadota bacterium]
MHKYLLAILTVVLLLAIIPAQAQGKDKTCVLFLYPGVTENAPGKAPLYARRTYLPDETLQAKLTEQGIVWTAEPLSTKMTWDYLKQFNVIVFLGYPMAEKHDTIKAALKEQEGLLTRFIAEGGGVLFTSSTEYGMWGLERDTEALNRFLKPYDAQVLSEQVEEKDKTLTLPSAGCSALAWTGNVAKSPLTEGVRGFLYPTDFAWTYYTHPLQTGDAWQVLLRGSTSAGSFTVKLGSGDATKRPGSYTGNPPLLAVRESGKGRLALWPVIPSTIIIDPYHQYWYNGQIMEGTNNNLPSDGRKLLFNVLNWLAAPSKEPFGGFVPPPVDTGMGDEVGFQAVNWDKVSITGKTFPNAYRGLVGMQSNLSGGASSPAEMIQAARDNGYQFAAFTEDLAKMTADKLDTLKKLCLDASSDTFQVYPGFSYRDESGNAWVTFGRTISWPKDDWWSTKRPGAITISNLIFRGFQFCPVVLVSPNLNPEPAWFQGNFKGFAVYTYTAGKQIDDATPVYQRLQENGYDLIPFVVHQVGSTTEVKAAAAAPFQTWTRWYELSDVLSAYSGNTSMYKGNYVFHRAPYISSGPTIEDFRVYNFGTADLAVPNNDRYRIHLAASSPKGLREIAIYDGQTLYRRFLLNGVTEWTQDIDGFQDKDRDFMAVVTDAAGGKAISADRWTGVQENALVRCTDNINTYTGGKDQTVKFFALRGLESYIERQAGAFNDFPVMGIPETERFAVDQHITSDSRFGYIKDDVLDYAYPPSASPNWNHNDQPEVAVPQTTFTGRTRVTLFSPRPSGTSAYLVEGDYTILRDLTIPRDAISVFQGNWTKDAEVLCIARPDGKVTCAKMGQRLTYQAGALNGVDYVANLAPIGGSRAFIPLSPDLNYAAMMGGEGRVYLGAGIPVPGKTLAKGQQFSYKYLAVWSTVNAPPDNSFVEEVCNTLGLRGKTAYTVTPKHGKVL